MSFNTLPIHKNLRANTNTCNKKKKNTKIQKIIQYFTIIVMAVIIGRLANSFVLMTWRNWNSLPASIFPITYHITSKSSKPRCLNSYISSLSLDQFPLLFGKVRIFRVHPLLYSIALKKIKKWSQFLINLLISFISLLLL